MEITNTYEITLTENNKILIYGNVRGGSGAFVFDTVELALEHLRNHLNDWLEVRKQIREQDKKLGD